MIGLKGIVAVIGVSALLIVGLIAFLHTQPTSSLRTGSNEPVSGPLTASEQRVVNPNPSNSMNPHVSIATNHGTITLEMYADVMPITTDNFVKLATSGFYNGTKFHRVIDGFMIQGGDPNTKGADVASYGTGGPGYTIQDEFVDDERLTNARGTISMANTGQPNSGGSQFFINLTDNTGLDYDKEPLSSKHPVFGRVIEGMDVVDAIGNVETGVADRPVEPVIVETVSVTEASE